MYIALMLFELISIKVGFLERPKTMHVLECVLKRIFAYLMHVHVHNVFILLLMILSLEFVGVHQ